MGGKFLVRGTNNYSPLDRYLKENGNISRNPYPEGRLLSGWKHLNRFYKLCRRPIFAKLQNKKSFSQFWTLVYAGSFYITVTKSPDGLIGDHPVILWYSSSFKRNFAIASTNFTEHFTKGAPTVLSDFIRNTILAKEFYQSEASQQEKIPL